MLEFTYRKFLFVTFVLAIVPFFVGAQATLININTASVTELDELLLGIGPDKAQAIVDYRNLNGPFQKIEDIQNVSGIKSATFAGIKDFITVGSTSETIQSNSQIDDSAQYDIAPVTKTSKSSTPSLSAGRDRTGVVGGPIEFRVETSGNIGSRQAFRWNFGDGSEGSGLSTTHVYDYPGEYVVVLSANLSGEEVTARVNVRVVDPGIIVTIATPERVELKNNSKYEANLFGRALIVGGQAFVFSRDTIIKAGQSISFSSKVTGLSPFNASDVEIMILGETENPKIIAKIEKQKEEKIASIENQISILQERMANIPHLAVKPPSGETLSEDVVAEEESPELEEPVPQTASAREGWLSLLKRFFLRTK